MKLGRGEGGERFLFRLGRLDRISLLETLRARLSGKEAMLGFQY